MNVALECGKKIEKIHKPYTIIICSKPTNNVFDENDDEHQLLPNILTNKNHSIIYNKTHKYIKDTITNITKTKFNASFDGVIIILLCIVRLYVNKKNRASFVIIAFVFNVFHMIIMIHVISIFISSINYNIQLQQNLFHQLKESNNVWNVQICIQSLLGLRPWN